jgi:hypothetical protein
LSFDPATSATDQVPLSAGRVSEVSVPQWITIGAIMAGNEPSADLKWRP